MTGPRVRPVGQVTDRQREVLGLLADGLTVAAIAAQLGISIHTAKAHVEGVRAALGARNRAHAVLIGCQLGLLPVGGGRG